MSPPTLIRLTALLLLFILASLPGCICLWREVHVEKPDPMHKQMVEVVSVRGTNFTLKDGRTFTLAGVSLDGLTPEQIKNFETNLLFSREVLIQETGNGYARLVFTMYGQDPDFENFFIPIIPIFVDFYPHRYDTAASLLEDGLAKADTSTVLNASPVPYPKRWGTRFPEPEIPSHMTYAQLLQKKQEEAQTERIGIFEGPAEQLITAVRTRNKTKVTQLLSEGVPVNTDIRNGRPLTIAMGMDDADMTALLLDHAATVPNSHSPYDWTWYSPNVLALLIKRGIPLPEGDKTNRILTMLISSSDATHLKIALEMGADPNAIGTQNTPLMYAAQYDNVGAVRLLLQHGADPSIKDSEGKTALDHAPKHSKTRALLEEAAPVVQPPTQPAK